MRWRGAVSVPVLLLTVAALDDITTDTANSFPVEYALLVISGIWFASVAGYLFRRSYPATGIVSAAAVSIGIVACWSLPHHYAPASWVTQLGWCPLRWVLGRTVWLLATRSRSSTDAGREPPTRAGDFRVPRQQAG